MVKAHIVWLCLVAGIMGLAACQHAHKTVDDDNNNPFFQANPSLKSITNQILADPGNARLYYERGKMLHRLDNDTLAIADYKRAARLDSTKAEYYSAVGDLLFEHKDLQGSVQWLQKALALNPNDLKAHLKIAKLFLYIRDYPKAIKEINTVLPVDKFNPEAYFLKGMVYKEMHDTAKAISSFQTAVQVEPDYREAVIQLGLIFSGKHDSIALLFLNNALKIDSTEIFPLYAQGVYYYDNHDTAKAKDIYRQCIYKDPRYADAYFNMGVILLQQDSTEKAWRQFNIAVQLQPDNPTAYYNRGLCSEIMNKTEEAITDYRQAYALDTAYKSPLEALKRLGAK
jgi:tetratricopeptide (TPR) repeat protein